jgi:chorismate mutase-like protein
VTKAGRRAADALSRIDELREAIDRLDERLVNLLNERARCALAIGALKRELGLEIYQPGREQDVLAHVCDVNPGPLEPAAVRRLFERIIDEARRLERIAASEEAEGS